jgi:hypothetical protein
MGRHISDDADQCAAQPPHHRLPGRVLGIPTGAVTVRGENYPGHSPSRLQPAAGRRLSAANLLRPAARGDAPSQPPSGGLWIQPGASAPGALAPTPAMIRIRTPVTVVIAGPPGRWVRHRLTPTRRGSVAAHPCRHRPHRGCTDRLVGARRCLARRATGAANTRGMHRPVRRSCWHRDHRPTGGLPALRAGGSGTA